MLRIVGSKLDLFNKPKKEDLWKIWDAFKESQMKFKISAHTHVTEQCFGGCNCVSDGGIQKRQVKNKNQSFSGSVGGMHLVGCPKAILFGQSPVSIGTNYLAIAIWATGQWPKNKQQKAPQSFSDFFTCSCLFRRFLQALDR